MECEIIRIIFCLCFRNLITFKLEIESGDFAETKIKKSPVIRGGSTWFKMINQQLLRGNFAKI